MYTYAFYQTSLAPLKLPHGITASLQTASANLLSAVIEPELSAEYLQQNDAFLVEAVLAHDRVIRSLFLQTSILPLRFGTSFSSLQGLLAHLQTHQQAYLNQLAQLQGKAEYTLKLTPIDLPEFLIASEIKGKDYFLAKKQHYQTQLSYQAQQQDAIRQIEQAIVQTYPRHYFSETQTEGKVMRLLVDRDRELQLWQHVQTLRQDYPQVQLSIEDPLPPYHFVTSPVERQADSRS